jgi:hypothetical protein
MAALAKKLEISASYRPLLSADMAKKQPSASAASRNRKYRRGWRGAASLLDVSEMKTLSKMAMAKACIEYDYHAAVRGSSSRRKWRQRENIRRQYGRQQHQLAAAAAIGESVMAAYQQTRGNESSNIRTVGYRQSVTDGWRRAAYLAG